MALANRLVGNEALLPALETALTGVALRFTAPTFVAVAGALAKCTLNRESVEQHTTIAVQSGDVLSVGPAEVGVRSYVAFAGGLRADDVLGSSSTYVPAGLGGHKGRALEKDDELKIADLPQGVKLLRTPSEFRLPILDAWSIRAGRSCETDSVDDLARLFDSKLAVGGRCDRMGIKLEGRTFVTDAGAQMPSVPVFPGTIQCPQDGGLYIMCVDAGTTGGYPRIAKIARMDLHILGQLRPGNSVRFIERNDEDAARELLDKHAYWQPWLADVADAI
jgi:biotin-dependent carboxylase-like uncharacterized protein